MSWSSSQLEKICWPLKVEHISLVFWSVFIVRTNADLGSGNQVDNGTRSGKLYESHHSIHCWISGFMWPGNLSEKQDRLNSDKIFHWLLDLIPWALPCLFRVLTVPFIRLIRVPLFLGFIPLQLSTEALLSLALWPLTTFLKNKSWANQPTSFYFASALISLYPSLLQVLEVFEQRFPLFLQKPCWLAFLKVRLHKFSFYVNVMTFKFTSWQWSTG